MVRRSIFDWIMNREVTDIPAPAPSTKLPLGPDVFRSVIGRFPLEPEGVSPVRVVNRETYDLSQGNVVLVTANTEYQIQGITTLSAVNIKARGGAVKMSVYEGQSGIVYTEIADGQSFEISAVPFGEIGKPMSFYVQSTVAGCIVEVIGLRLF